MTSRDVVFAEQPHSAENVGSSATSSTKEIVHLVPPQRPEEGKEELSDEDDSHIHQTAGAPKDKPLPKWAQQLFDDRNPKPEVPETSADGLRRSKRIEE